MEGLARSAQAAIEWPNIAFQSLRFGRRVAHCAGREARMRSIDRSSSRRVTRCERSQRLTPVRLKFEGAPTQSQCDMRQAMYFPPNSIPSGRMSLVYGVRNPVQPLMRTPGQRFAR